MDRHVIIFATIPTLWWPFPSSCATLRAMYGSLASVLLLGLIPSWDSPGAATIALRSPVAPPAFIGGPALPLLQASDQLSASGIVVMDVQSSQILFERGADTVLPMASLTKLMTALLVVERGGLDSIVTVPQQVQRYAGTSTATIRPGEQLTIGNLLTAMLVASSNEAAFTLALQTGGDITSFIRAMNERARSLGLAHTTYDNPTGFDDPLQHSTPRDLAWLAMYVFQKEEIARRLSTKQASIRSLSGTLIRLSHTHQLLHEDSSVIAGKTGTTDAAKECLLSIVEKAGRFYVVVLLKSRDRYGDTRLILDAIPISSRAAP